MQKEFNNVFEIPLKGKNGEEMFLKQFEGKVIIFVNTTGECGNAPQWPIVDAIAKEYKNKGVEIIYVPTNDYCGSVTFNQHKDGISCGADSAEYAKKTYNIDGNFTELLSSRNKPWTLKVGEFDRSTKIWTMHPEKEYTIKQAPRDHLFRFLIGDPNAEPIQGNFHKIITNKYGIPVAQFSNHLFNEGEKDIQDFRKILDEIIEKDYTTSNIYDHDPYEYKTK